MLCRGDTIGIFQVESSGADADDYAAAARNLLGHGA